MFGMTEVIFLLSMENVFLGEHYFSDKGTPENDIFVKNIFPEKMTSVVPNTVSTCKHML